MALTLAQINNAPSLKPPLDWLEDEEENNLPILPIEIINKILFEFGGYQTPSANIIKTAIDNYSMLDSMSSLDREELKKMPWIINYHKNLTVDDVNWEIFCEKQKYINALLKKYYRLLLCNNGYLCTMFCLQYWVWNDYWNYQCLQNTYSDSRIRRIKEPNFLLTITKSHFINNNTKTQIKELFEELGIKFTKSHTKEKLYNTYYKFMLKD